MENQLIEKIKNDIEETTTCFICKKKIQTSKMCPFCHKCACASCIQNLPKCPHCKNRFLSKKPQRFPYIDDLQKINQILEENERKQCTLHNHSFRFHCFTCNKTLCSDCYAFFHDRSHNIVLLSNVSNPELPKILPILNKVETTLKELSFENTNPVQLKINLLQQMKESDMKYLDNLRDTLCAKYDQLINQLKQYKDKPNTFTNEFQVKKTMLMDVLRNLHIKSKEINYENNMKTLFKEIDELQKKYMNEIEMNCNNIKMNEMKEWDKKMEMMFKVKEYKEGEKSKNKYYYGFCEWEVSLKEENGKLNVIVGLKEECLKGIKEDVMFEMDVELENCGIKECIQKKGISMAFKEGKNEFVVNGLCGMEEIKKEGFTDEEGCVEVKLDIRFKDIRDFVRMGKM